MDAASQKMSEAQPTRSSLTMIPSCGAHLFRQLHCGEAIDCDLATSIKMHLPTSRLSGSRLDSHDQPGWSSSQQLSATVIQLYEAISGYNQGESWFWSEKSAENPAIHQLSGHLARTVIAAETDGRKGLWAGDLILKNRSTHRLFAIRGQKICMMDCCWFSSLSLLYITVIYHLASVYCKGCCNTYLFSLTKQPVCGPNIDQPFTNPSIPATVPGKMWRWTWIHRASVSKHPLVNQLLLTATEQFLPCQLQHSL